MLSEYGDLEPIPFLVPNYSIRSWLLLNVYVKLGVSPKVLKSGTGITPVRAHRLGPTIRALTVRPDFLRSYILSI